MEFNISHLVINIDRQNITPIFISILSAIAAWGSWHTSINVQKQSLLIRRMEHFRNLQNVIGEFQKLIPYNFKNEKFNIEKIIINDKNITRFKNLHLKLNLLANESKYLFTNIQVQNFENDFYTRLIKIQCFYKKDIITNIQDSISSDVEHIANKIIKRDEFFEKDLSIALPLMTKIMRLFKMK